MRASSMLTLLLAPLPLFAVAGALHPDSVSEWQRPKRGASAEKDAEFWRQTAQQTLKEQLRKDKIFGRAKNVIFFLGDGMSIPTLAATRLYVGQQRGLSGEEQELSFEKFPYTGLSKTYCVDAQVADSACSATAYLCGVKANFATIGVSAAVQRGDCNAQNNTSNHVTSILQWAQEAGKSTGVVTTTRVTHASPAGTYAHTANREWENDAVVQADGFDPATCDDIAEQLVRRAPGNRIQVVLGGGRANFRPSSVVDEEGSAGARLDNTDLLAEWRQDKKLRGVTGRYVWDRDGLLRTDVSRTDYLLGLFEAGHMQYHLDANNQTEPTLPEMTQVALAMLQKNPKGFFLFVEGGRIDHGHHENKVQKALDETQQLHESVELAQRLTNNSDTLIIVTSDHAHVLSLNGYPARGSPVFGVAGLSDVDNLPYTTLSYANGPGYRTPQQNGTRYDVSSDNIGDKEYMFPAGLPLSFETHGGDDVAVFANGPWAQLFTGVFEQNVIPHIVAFSACLGPGLTACDYINTELPWPSWLLNLHLP